MILGLHYQPEGGFRTLDDPEGFFQASLWRGRTGGQKPLKVATLQLRRGGDGDASD